MTIAVGDTLPTLTIKTNGAKGPEDLNTGDFFKGRKVVLFAVPGAFTPGCSNTHMPGFVINADAILELDATGGGMGIRSKRFALIANDGVVEYLGVDEKGVDKSSADTVLGQL